MTSPKEKALEYAKNNGWFETSELKKIVKIALDEQARQIFEDIETSIGLTPTRIKYLKNKWVSEE